jgi:hypothetical protein
MIWLATPMRMSLVIDLLTDRSAFRSSGSRAMPDSRRRPAARRVARPNASGCEPKCLDERRANFAAFPARDCKLCCASGKPPARWHVRAKQRPKIAKQLPPSALYRTASGLLWLLHGVGWTAPLSSP